MDLSHFGHVVTFHVMVNLWLAWILIVQLCTRVYLIIVSWQSFRWHGRYFVSVPQQNEIWQNAVEEDWILKNQIQTLVHAYFYWLVTSRSVFLFDLWSGAEKHRLFEDASESQGISCVNRAFIFCWRTSWGEAQLGCWAGHHLERWWLRIEACSTLRRFGRPVGDDEG